MLEVAMFLCYLGLAGVQVMPAEADQLHRDEIRRFRFKLRFKDSEPYRGSVIHMFGIFNDASVIIDTNKTFIFNTQILQSADVLSPT